MNKKLILLSVVLLLISSFIPGVVAVEEGGMVTILDTFENIFGFIPNTLEKLWGGDATAIFLAKFLIWIMLYSALYFGLGFVFKEHRGPRIAISISIAILGTAIIPTEIIINIFLTYMVIGSVLILAIPFLFGWYMISKLPKEGSYNYIRAFIYILLIFVLFSMRSSIAVIATTQGVSPSALRGLKLFNSFFALFMLVAIIGIFSNLFRGVSGRGVTDYITSRTTGTGGGLLDRLGRGGERQIQQELSQLGGAERDTQRALGELESLRSSLQESGAAPELIKGVTDTERRLRDFGSRVESLYRRTKIVETIHERIVEGEKQYVAKEKDLSIAAKQARLQRLLSKAFGGMNFELDKLEREAVAARDELKVIVAEVEKLKREGLSDAHVKIVEVLLADLRTKMDYVLKVTLQEEKAAKRK